MFFFAFDVSHRMFLSGIIENPDDCNHRGSLMGPSIALSDALRNPVVDLLFHKGHASGAEVDGIRKLAVSNEFVEVLSRKRDALRRTQFVETKKLCRHRAPL